MSTIITVDLVNPFPGLRPFREGESDRFFGQEDQVEDLAYRLSRQRFVALLGLSGSGKSSLINAGLFPQLRLVQPDGRPRWLIARLNPGDDPLTNLATSLANALGKPREEVRDELNRDSRALPRLAGRRETEAGDGSHQKILLVVDQFEELFRLLETNERGDLPPRKNEASLFVELLLEAVRDEDCPVHILFSMRSEFLGDCALFYGLAERVNAATYLIPKMDRESVVDVIVEPVELRGAAIDPSLVQHLVNESEALEDGLPLLQHALHRLWERWIGRRDPTSPIGWKDLGERSLEAQLNQHLDSIYDKELTAAQQGVAQRLFRELADRDAKGRIIRRRVEYSTLELPQLDAVVNAFLDEKHGRTFLIRSEGKLDISHECLLRRWGKVRGWLEMEDLDRKSLLELTDAASRSGWPRPKAPLEGLQLETLSKWLANSSIDTKWAERYRINYDHATKFLEWSQAQQRTKKLRQRLALIGFIAVALATAAIMTWLWLKAQRETTRAEDLAAEAAVSAKQAASERDHAVATEGVATAARGEAELDSNAAKAAEAKAAQSARETKDQLVRNYWQSSRVAMEHGEGLEAAQFGAAAVQGDPALLSNILLDLRELKLPQQVLLHEAPVKGALFNRDESRILTWSDDHTARLWDAHTGQVLGQPLQHKGPVNGALFSRDESRILTWSDDHTAQLWDAKTGQPLGQPLRHESRVNGALFNRDGSRVLTWSGEPHGSKGVVRVWDAHTGQALGRPLQHKAPVNGALFNRDESRILTWSGDGTARVWDAHTGQALGQPLQHKGPVNGALFNQDESRILTWTDYYAARVWDAHTGQAVGLPLQHESYVNGALFNRDESRILTWSDDYTARLWDAHTDRALGQPLLHEDSVKGALFNWDESLILTWGGDNFSSRAARLWDAHTGQDLGHPLQHKDSVEGALFNRDGSRILTWSDDHTARLWDAHTGQPLGQPLQHKDSVKGAVFNRDESRILTWSDDHTARLWDTHTGQALGQPFQHEGPVNGALFNWDGSRILTWDEAGTARLWFLDADLDFPPEHFQLWIQAMTATEMDPVTHEVKPIEPARWRKIKAQYDEVAAKHAKVCKYRDANNWLRSNK